jgi:general secretion pathway protein E
VNDAAVAEAPAATPVDRRPSFAFAKRHGVLVKRVIESVAECACRENATPLAIAEVRRYMRVPLKLERVPEAEFDNLLRLAYEGGSLYDAGRRRPG